MAVVQAEGISLGLLMPHEMDTVSVQAIRSLTELAVMEVSSINTRYLTEKSELGDIYPRRPWYCRSLLPWLDMLFYCETIGNVFFID